MLTTDEFNALLVLLQRVALTPLEAVGLNVILAKLAPKPPAPAEKAPDASAGS